MINFYVLKFWSLGRYNLDGANLQRTFEVHAHAHGKEPSDMSLDLEEFKSICFQANDAVSTFKSGEQEFELKLQNAAAIAVCCSCLFCPCTCGCSCCVCPYLCGITTLQKERADRAFSYSDRLNKLLEQELVKPNKI